MADKPIQLISGVKTEVEATVVSAGGANAGDIVALDGSGKLDSSVLPSGIGADTTVLPSSENLAAGDFVNIWNDSGTLKVRKADASGGVAKQADGFVLAAVTAPANATVYHEGTNDQLSGLTIGSRYYLSGTAGGVTATAPSTAAHIVQYVGKAKSTTAIAVEMDEPVVKA